MDRSITQALNGLIPTFNGPLPPELVELAASLLAQSRSKASSLKAEEEIARSYACANLACERCETPFSQVNADMRLSEGYRLKQTLNLPKIQPRPPCPPRVYQKLYKYLDSALPARARRNVQAPRARGLDSTPVSSPAKPRTPAKQAHVRPDLTPKRKTPQRLASSSSEAPRWVMPAIRRLCKRMEAPAAPHHIFAGVSSILSAQAIASKNKATANAVKTPALIVAVFILATTRLSGAEMPASEYQRQRGQALQTLYELSGEEMAMEDVGNLDVDNCMRQVRDQGWTEMDWFENIPAGAGLDVSNVIDEVADNNEDHAEGEQLLLVMRKHVGKVGLAEGDYLQPGLGTMV